MVANKFILLFLLPACVWLNACSNKKEAPVFSVLSSRETGIDFTNTLTDHDSLNILDYLYDYNGGGVAAGDINNDGLPDIYFTANSTGNNKLYLNKGNFRFEEITASAGVAGGADWCSGVTMADVNGDGWLDIYVCAVSQKLGLKGHNQLFINNHNNTFSDSSAAYGLAFAGYATQAAFFDYDHDGDLDCFLLNQSSHSVETYGDTSRRRDKSEYSGCRLFRNEKSRNQCVFTDVTDESGIYQSALGYGLGLAVADLNNDGWDDVYVGNDFHENDYYYINLRNGTFAESGAEHFNHYSRFSMGNDVADYNNDGAPDVFTADMLPSDETILKTYAGGDQLDIYTNNIIGNGFQNQFSRNALQKNLGDGAAFSDVALQNGVAATDWSWCPLFGDWDNDGQKDLFITNGIVKRPVDLDYMKFISSPDITRKLNTSREVDKEVLAKMPDGKTVNAFFKGNYKGFTDVSKAWGLDVATYSNGAAYADFDNDGRLDLVVNNVNEEAMIYRNGSSAANHFLSLSFAGNDNNTNGIGCKAYVFTNGKLQYAQLMLTRGFQSSSEARLHFGLDTCSVVDSLLIVWPNERYQVVKRVKANQFLTMHQSDATDSFSYHSFFPLPKPLFTDVTRSVNLPWKHRENAFVDFNEQSFIPHELSTRGPKLAVGDVNGDGWDDFFVCGAKGQPGALFLQTEMGRFVAGDATAFELDKMCEDVDALFFDADGDGDLDLYVASGGNEYWGNNQSFLKDRLYLNDGRGKFALSHIQLPQILENKGAVCAADVDNDGDQDLFIGVGAGSLSYGVAQESYLLLNDGKGNFHVSGNDVFHLPGVLSSALFADVNGDGWQDLIVAGEWMPVTLFLNHKGRFERGEALTPTGWWQSLAAADVNGDGLLDVLAGNFGLNSKLSASEKAPVKLYIKDFDNNGTADPLLTYIKEGKEYTFLGKEELEKQLPYLRKNFLQYSSFAGKTVPEVFGGRLNDAVVLQAQSFASMLLINKSKGEFEAQLLPGAAQVSPLFAFATGDVNGDGLRDILSGGNFFGVLPYEGQYDADWGDVLLNRGNNDFSWLSPVQSGWKIHGEVRDIKKIKTKGGSLYVIARNNETLVFMKANE